MQIKPATPNDLPEILQLQYLAYQSEAKLVHNDSIQPLTQTLAELENEYRQGVILKAVDDETGAIIGSVRGRVENGTLYIGKLMVHPERQGNGIGTQLLKVIEERCPQQRYELFTSSQSIRNIRLYERAGYRRWKELETAPGLKMVYLEKFHP
jgi:GNAT superfamily N-acetyltransferase